MITNYKTILWLGIILLIIPFLGVPSSWKDFMLFIIALILISISLFQRNSEKMKINGENDEDVFVENGDAEEETKLEDSEEVDEEDEENENEEGKE
jgi:membrane protein implicated in regulation of membrane protease activity